MKYCKPILISLIIFCGLLIQKAPAQTFSQFTTSFSGFSQGTAAWADFDKDGYLDVLIHGILSNAQPATKLYRNNQGNFVEVNSGIMALKNGSARWGDFDNDGDPDLLICGVTDAYNAKTLIYRNDNGVFTNINAGLSGCNNGMAIWGDYNNDGFIDVLLSGDSLSYHATTLLYKNNGDGSFSDVEAGLPGALSSALAFGDYDNDGDLDIILCGDIGGMYSTMIFRNDEGSFTNTNIIFDGAGAGTIHFFDYDKDMDMDIAFIGNDLTLTPTFKLYRNDGNNEFTEIITAITGMALGNLAIADFDNDGWPDIISTGKTNGCGTSATVLYRNNQAGNFWQSSASFPDLSYSNASWADFDNDGDKDLLLLGLTGTGSTIARLYRNSLGTNAYTPNTPPQTPQGLTASTDKQTVIIKWNKSTDDNTPAKALSYNLKVGINPGMMEIMGVAADFTTGAPRLYETGNVCQDTSWTLKGLREGTYFYSVQSCDHSFSNSTFTTEESFEISINTGVETNTGNSIALFPNPANDKLTIITKAEGKHILLQILGTDGRTILEERTNQPVVQKDVSGFTPGIYFIRVLKDGKTEQRKLIIY
ncbi:MAG: T9SS type A sorting domain-containing protein [Bacteroidales bacterium]|nr:T9SS type A sorting domain-containing protein [Bacteroidales bacterium]